MRRYIEDQVVYRLAHIRDSRNDGYIFADRGFSATWSFTHWSKMMLVYESHIFIRISNTKTMKPQLCMSRIMYVHMLVIFTG